MSGGDRRGPKAHQSRRYLQPVVVGAVVEICEELNLSFADLVDAYFRCRLVLDHDHPTKQIRLKGGGPKAGRVERIEELGIGRVGIDVDPAGSLPLTVERSNFVDHVGIRRVPHQDPVVVRDRNPMHQQRGRLVEAAEVGAVGIARKIGQRLEPRAP
jgi:hypothetical protein